MSNTRSNMLKENELDVPRSAPTRPKPDLTRPGTGTASKAGSLFWTVVGLVLIAAVVALAVKWKRSQGPATGANSAAGRAAMPVPVVAGTVRTEDMPVYLDGLGTVQAFNTVTVRSRVDGQIVRIGFQEGQDVHKGDLLAQIDPAPFQAQLDQSIARKAQDEAQLAVANLTAKRDADLLASKILAQQDYDTQSALVQQLQAAVNADAAAIENAQVQLGYTRIVSPLDGRVGLRLVDEGNIVHANDSNGIVVITQLHPISVVFTLPEQALGQVQEHLSSADPLSVMAVDRGNRGNLGQGKLAVVDNQIDWTTGTIRLKATFPNEDLRLWPGQFVNARLLLTVRKGVTVVPAQVIQRGPEGAYAYIIRNDETVDVRRVQVGQVEQGEALIEEGLQPGDQVVVDGQYKLQRGAKVKVGQGNAPAEKTGSGRKLDLQKSKADLQKPKAH